MLTQSGRGVAFTLTPTVANVGDIEALLTMQPGPLLFPGSTMDEANKAMVKEFVPQLVKFGSWSEAEWLERLGL